MASTFSVNQSVKITKVVVDRAAVPAHGQTLLRDRELKGFGLRITAGGAKSFIVEKRINGRVRRITLGSDGSVRADQHCCTPPSGLLSRAPRHAPRAVDRSSGSASTPGQRKGASLRGRHFNQR